MNKKTYYYLTLCIGLALVSAASCIAQPYGKGTYNSNVPYGSETSLSISTNGNVSISATPSSTGQVTKSTSIVTITSTDVVGYKLYIRALNNTYLDNGGLQIPASANGTPAALSLNTWGYNMDASDNFLGITVGDVLIRSATAPAPSGEANNVTFGVNLDMTKLPGNYSTGVIYTAVPQTD